MNKPRLLRAVDVRFLLSIAALVVATTVCWGFVQRGNHITSAEESISSLSAQLAEVSADNRSLRRQLVRNNHQAQHRDREADRQRDLLLHELTSLNRWLRENGIIITVTSTRLPRPATPPVGSTSTPAPQHHASPSGGHSSPGHNGGSSHHNGGKGGGHSSTPNLPGHAPAHSHAGGKGRGHGHGKP